MVDNRDGLQPYDPKEIFLDIPSCSSIWGKIDILNTDQSSQESTRRVVSAISAFPGNELFVGMRSFSKAGEFRSPLVVYDFDPRYAAAPPLEEMATAINGPLSRSEAIAAGYLLETAVVTQDIFEGRIELLQQTPNPLFEALKAKIPGSPRFLPLGLLTLNDYISRMSHYRRARAMFEREEIDENDDEDMAIVVGQGIIPLARAFRLDQYQIGDNFEDTLTQIYAGNPRIFIPFAGIDQHPKTHADSQLVGLGLLSGVKLFRQIRDHF